MPGSSINMRVHVSTRVLLAGMRILEHHSLGTTQPQPYHHTIIVRLKRQAKSKITPSPAHSFRVVYYELVVLVVDSQSIV